MALRVSDEVVLRLMGLGAQRLLGKDWQVSFAATVVFGRLGFAVDVSPGKRGESGGATKLVASMASRYRRRGPNPQTDHDQIYRCFDFGDRTE